jgi:hypothetical protein
MPRFPVLFVSLAVPLAAAATVPVYTLGARHERALETALERSAQNAISATSEQKAKRLDALGRERVRMALALAADPAARAILGGERSTDSPAAARRDEQMRALGVSEVAVLDADCGLVLAREAPRSEAGRLDEAPSRELGPEDVRERDRARKDALRRLRDAAAITHPDMRSKETGSKSMRPALEAIAPVREGGTTIGHVAVALDVASIDAILDESTGLGATGESICAVVLGNEVVVTTPTRADPDAAYTLRWSFGGRKLQRLEEVLFGNSSRGADKDLEGRALLGAWTRIESLGWVIAVTQHREEIMAPLEPMRRQTTVVGAIAAASALVASAIIAWLLARASARREATARAAASTSAI